MSDSRQRILGAVRAALTGRAGPDDTGAASVRPALGTAPRVAQLADRLRQSGATVEAVPDPAAAGRAIAAYLANHGLSPVLPATRTPWLDGELRAAGVTPEYRAARDADGAGLAMAAAATAETGAVILRSGTGYPTSPGFLPPHCIVAVPAHRVVDHLDDGWALAAEDAPPRALHFITGPSRTADIEQTLQQGAHGPCHLHVVIFGPDAARLNRRDTIV